MDTHILHPTKACTKCGTQYPATLEYFGADKRRKDGLRSYCLACHRESSRCWRKANAERHREYSRRWRQENPERERETNRLWKTKNAERHREYSRRWAARNAERHRETNRRRYAQNPEKQREASRRWQKVNPEKKRVNNHNRRARELTAEGTHTVIDIKTQYQRQKGKCYYCKVKMTQIPHQSNSATVDHVVPLTRGGRNAPDNIVIACQHCNFSKHNKLPHEWASGGRLL